MSYATEYIAETLKAAREAKGLSQRDLSSRAGVPQSHISKIESGVVDLRLSSLISLARVLDLELALVPRKIMPAVQLDCQERRAGARCRRSQGAFCYQRNQERCRACHQFFRRAPWREGGRCASP